MCLGNLDADPALTAEDFRGIPLASWLDLMLEYAVLLARSHDMTKAYQVLNVAKGANVFYSSVDSMFLIHVCWLSRRSIPVIGYSSQSLTSI